MRKVVRCAESCKLFVLSERKLESGCDSRNIEMWDWVSTESFKRYKYPYNRILEEQNSCNDIAMGIMRFAWDFARTKENQVKHGVLFEEAQTAFPDDGSRLDDQIIPALSNASYNSPRSGNQGSARFRNRKSS